MREAAKKRPPVAATTEGQPKTLEANGPLSLAQSHSTCKRGNREGRSDLAGLGLRIVGPVADNTATEQPGSEPETLPGFVGQPVWELAKHDGRLVAGEREFKGTRFFELRLWGGEDGTQPTKKGVTLPPGEVESLARALTAYAAQNALSGAENGN